MVWYGMVYIHSNIISTKALFQICRRSKLLSSAILKDRTMIGAIGKYAMIRQYNAVQYRAVAIMDCTYSVFTALCMPIR